MTVSTSVLSSLVPETRPPRLGRRELVDGSRRYTASSLYTMAELSRRSAATSATAGGELDLSSILSAPSRWLAICQSASLAVSPAGFTGGFAMKSACAIVLQVKEFFYRSEQISTPLGIA
jgi:hypothetical protein